jgi:hypothetical protein
MDVFLSLPIDCLVISQPHYHTLQSIPLYIIPNPLQALAIHSGCHLGRFPFLPYAFHIVSLLIKQHFQINNGPRFAPFNRLRFTPQNTLVMNATNTHLIIDPDIELQPGPVNNTHQDQGQTQFTAQPLPTTQISPIDISIEHQPLSGIDQQNINHDESTTQIPPKMNPQIIDASVNPRINPLPFHEMISTPYSFYTLFLLSAAEVSYLHKLNIIRLIDPYTHKTINTQQDFLPQNTPQNAYTIDFSALTAHFNWRLTQTIKYACTDVVYRYKPYQNHCLIEKAKDVMRNAPLSDSSKHFCQFHSRQRQQNPNSTNNTQSDEDDSIHPNNNNNPAFDTINSTPFICTCPMVNLSQSTNNTSPIFKLPLSHPPHDHSTYTFVYPQNLSHSFASRQPAQRFVGYNPGTIPRVLESVGYYEIRGGTTGSEVMGMKKNLFQGNDNNFSKQKAKNNTIGEITTRSNYSPKYPSMDFIESKSGSILSQFESIVSLSSKVSKETYKQFVNIKPVSIAPIRTYEFQKSVGFGIMGNVRDEKKEDLEKCTSDDKTNIINTQLSLTSSLRTPKSQSSFTTQISDLNELFGDNSPNVREVSQQSQTQSRSNERIQNDLFQYKNHCPTQHIALVGNLVKFQHYSNRVPVHTG